MMKLVDTINESVIGDIITKSLGRLPKVATSAAEISIKKLVSELLQKTVAKGGVKRISRKLITNNVLYQKTIADLANETAMIVHKMPLEDVVKKIGRDASDEIVKKAGATVDNALSQAVKEAKATIEADVKSTQAAVNAAKSTKVSTTELEALLKQLKPNQKMAREAIRMEKLLQNMDQVTYKKLVNQINKGSKVTTGTGPTISPTLPPGTVTVSTPKGFFTATLDQLRSLPGRVRRIVVTKYALKTAAALGVGVAAIYLIYRAIYPEDSLLLTDEDGKDLGDTDLPTGEWDSCVQELLNNKEATLMTLSNGLVVVRVVTPEYPQGLNFYSNGRVADVATKKMGTWKCKGGVTTIQEQTEDDINSDVEKMIDLLDFPVTQGNLVDAVTLLQKYVNNPKGKEFLSLYQQSGWGGGDLKKSVSNIFTTDTKSVRAKNKLLSLYDNIISGTSGGATVDGKKGLKDIEINWDGDKKDGTVITPPKKGGYVDCNEKPLPHKFGCKSDKIAEVQKCLDINSDGKFGPVTRKTLLDNEYDPVNGLTQEIYDAVIAKCKKEGDKLEPKIEPVPHKSTEPIYAPEKLKLSDLVPKIKLPEKLGPIKLPEATPKELYLTFLRGGLLKGEEGNDRIKYKGPELDAKSLEKLDAAFTNMGYQRIKQIDKRYGDKYVYEKIKTT